MRRMCCLICAALIILSGCTPTGVVGDRSATDPSKDVAVTEIPNRVEVSKPASSSQVSEPRHPEPIGQLTHEGVAVTVQSSNEQVVARLHPSSGAVLIPVEDKGYEVEFLFDYRQTVEGLPRVDSTVWQVTPNSIIRWVTHDGMTVIRCHIGVNDSFRTPLPVGAAVDVPINLVFSGVRDGKGNPVPLSFTLYPKHLFITVSDSQNVVLGGTDLPLPAEVLAADDYHVEILFHRSFFAEDATVRVETPMWGIRGNSARIRINKDETTTLDFVIAPYPGVGKPPVAPIQVSVTGVEDGDGLPFPLQFALDPKEPVPPPPPPPSTTVSSYGLTYNGVIVPDSRLFSPRQEYANGDYLLLPFGTDNEIAADYRVALHDSRQGKTLFVADLASFSGLRFWTGWLNEREFFIGNNYNLTVYNVSGEKREIFKLSDPTHRTAIHGLGWSRATQTMAVLYCDGRTDGIDLVLLTDDFETTTKVASVDKQDWYKGGGEAFPMQTAAMLWDEQGERLAFTKTRNHMLAIYTRSTGAIEDVIGITKVSKIEYDPETKQFTTFQSR